MDTTGPGDEVAAGSAVVPVPPKELGLGDEVADRPSRKRLLIWMESDERRVPDDHLRGRPCGSRLGWARKERYEE